VTDRRRTGNKRRTDGPRYGEMRSYRRTRKAALHYNFHILCFSQLTHKAITATSRVNVKTYNLQHFRLT